MSDSEKVVLFDNEQFYRRRVASLIIEALAKSGRDARSISAEWSDGDPNFLLDVVKGMADGSTDMSLSHIADIFTLLGFRLELKIHLVDPDVPHREYGD